MLFFHIIGLEYSIVIPLLPSSYHYNFFAWLSESVFDLVSDKDKQRLESIHQSSGKSTAIKTTPPVASTPTTVETPKLEKKASAPPLPQAPTASYFSSSGAFKPFAKDAAKQARYEIYLSNSKLGLQGWIICCYFLGYIYTYCINLSH